MSVPVFVVLLTMCLENWINVYLVQVSTVVVSDECVADTRWGVNSI